MNRRLLFIIAVGAAVLAAAPRPCAAQGQPGIRPDSIVVQGLHRLSRADVLQTVDLAPGRLLGYRDVQHAIQVLYATGQYADVQVVIDSAAGRQLLVLQLREEPLLVKWTIRGVVHLSEKSVRDRVQVAEVKVPPLALQFTAPPGIVVVPRLVSVTVAVQVAVPPLIPIGSLFSQRCSAGS